MNLRHYQEYLFLCGQSSVDVKAQTHGKSLAQYCMIQAAKLPCVPACDNVVCNIAASNLLLLRHCAQQISLFTNYLQQ